MDIHTHRFDMTNPFAQVKQRLAQADTVLQQIPPTQRRALVEAMQTPITTPTPRSIDVSVMMTSVPEPEWGGGRDVMPRSGTPRQMRRPRQRTAPMPLFWRWLVKAERLQRQLQRQWQGQSQALRREVRLWLRDAKRHNHRHRHR